MIANNPRILISPWIKIPCEKCPLLFWAQLTLSVLSQIKQQMYSLFPLQFQLLFAVTVFTVFWLERCISPQQATNVSFKKSIKWFRMVKEE